VILDTIKLPHLTRDPPARNRLWVTNPGNSPPPSPQSTETYDIYVAFCTETAASAIWGTHWMIILVPRFSPTGTWWYTLPIRNREYDLRKETNKDIYHPCIVSRHWIANIPVSEVGDVKFMMMHDVPTQHTQRWVVSVLIGLERKCLVAPSTSSRFMRQVQPYLGHAYLATGGRIPDPEEFVVEPRRRLE